MAAKMNILSVLFVTELNDREEKDSHFPIVYGIGEYSTTWALAVFLIF